MRLRHAVIAALGFAVVPQAALAQSDRITPVVSTTMQRTCEAETSAVQLVNGGVDIPDARPTVETQTRALKVVRSGDGHLFEQTATGPQGDTALRFRISAAGTVTEASLTGSAFDAYTGGDLPALASTFAEDVPERLLLGRTFAVGDPYYPEALSRSLFDRMFASMGIPFPVSGSADIQYRGESTHAGRRAWRFAGDITAGGSGDVGGRPAAFDQVTRVDVLHDVETGLVLRYSATADTKVSVGGRPMGRQRTTDVYDCQIVPQ